MDHTGLDNRIMIMLFENAPIDQVVPIIRETLQNGDRKTVINMMDCMLAAQLNETQLSAVIGVVEEFFLLHDLLYLCKYLFLLYRRKGDELMARYYLDQCATEVVGDIEQLILIIRETLQNSEHKLAISMMDRVLAAQLDETQLSTVIDVAEEFFLLHDLHYLCKYLFLLYHKKGDEGIARYYLDQCAEEIEGNVKYAKERSKYALTPIQDFSNKNYCTNNFSKEYVYNGITKSYSIFSFSNEIGQNMTLLKTPYGAIIFDCGAKCSTDNTLTITTEELKGFLLSTGTANDDVRAIVISHAHLDHYGSLATLINYGFELSRVFMSEGTKRLINIASDSMIDLDRVRPISDFFIANNSIRITSFVNGHIVGSEGYLVTFDELNVFYTGDYCLHDQLSVKGLDPALLKNLPEVQKTGIDCLITESTYGHTQHYLKHEFAEHVLSHFVGKLLQLGYKIFLPSFAIGRSQEIALMLNKDYSVLIDGLAIKVSLEYEKLTGLTIYNNNTRYSTATDDSEKLRNLDCNNVIIASSGMLSKDSTSYKYVTGFLNGDRNIAIIKTGFINGESYGNELIEQWRGQNNILLDISLSAHAGYDEIARLICELDPKNIVAIHGDGVAHVDGGGTQENGGNYMRSRAPVPYAKRAESATRSGVNSPNAENGAHESAEEVLGTVAIEDRQIKSKMDNIVKTGGNLKANMVDLKNSMPFATACRILVRFLKTKEEYIEIYRYLASLSDYAMFFEYVKECVDSGYLCRIKREESVADVRSDIEQAEEIVRQKEAESIAKQRRKTDGVSTATDTIYQSDIMIVKCAENDYYVAEKIQDEEPYYILLADRADRSVHYEQYQEAYSEAERKRELLLSKSPNCKIVDIDILDYPYDGYRPKNSNIQSDIMIVKIDDGNYYVSEKIHGRVLYNKLLMERSRKSTHFYSYQEARTEAERLYGIIADENPDCQIIDVDILDYPKNSKSPYHIICDDDGNIIASLTEKGKLTFEFRDDEKEYRLIDVVHYQEAMDELCNENKSDGLDFYIAGVQQAYQLAKDCALPCIRYEIYKAREMLKSFEVDKELYSCDTQFYNGFIKGLYDAIEVQKRCKLEEQHWVVHVLNLSKIHPLGINGITGKLSIGDYKLVEHSDVAEFVNQNGKYEAHIVFTNQKRFKSETGEELNLQDKPWVAFCQYSGNKKAGTKELYSCIVQTFEKIFWLGEGESALRIEEDWVESLSQLGIHVFSDKTQFKL